MSALDGFYSTWYKARETFGVGTPPDGSQYDGSSQLLRMKGMIDSAAKHDGWQGTGADAYAAANKEHATVYGKLAELDKQMAAEVTNAANIVTTGREQLDATKSWVESAVSSLPGGLSAQARETSLIPIAKEGITRVNNTVGTANGGMLKIGFRLTELKNEFDELQNQKLGPGEKKGETKAAEDTREPRTLEDMGLPANASERGEADGKALAHQADLPPDQRDPKVLDRVADHLPQNPLNDNQLKDLAKGKDVADVPKEALDYYRKFYDAAGKDGLLTLDRHLESKETAGDTQAGSQRDRLANGLTVLSNEKVVERNPDGSEAWRGGYYQLPSDVRGLIESRRTDILPIDGQSPVSPLAQRFADVSQLGELLGESNPKYQPGTELGTELYLKAADMVEPAAQGLPEVGTTWEEYQRAASSFADVAGRNNDASAAIWSGQGEHLPIGYDREHTVRTLLNEDWSKVGGGTGAATLLDWMNEDSPRSRQALVELPQMLAPGGDDSAWNSQHDNFARNTAISTELGKVLGTHIDSTYNSLNPTGFEETKLDPNGNPRLSASDSSRLFQLASYTEEGRIHLTAAAEAARISEIADAMKENPGNVSGELANSPAGALSGRIDNSIMDTIDRQNADLQEQARNELAYKAKMSGAIIAGDLANELYNKIPGSSTVSDYTGLDPGEQIENRIRDFVGEPKYQNMPIPTPEDAAAASTSQAEQAVLQAALKAKILPPALHDGENAVDIKSIYEGDPRYGVVEQFLKDHQLSQYIKDYGQSYSAMFNVERDSKTKQESDGE